jgi:ABC-type multidrug transport system fused ATPase/permease subunit
MQESKSILFVSFLSFTESPSHYADKKAGKTVNADKKAVKTSTADEEAPLKPTSKIAFELSDVNFAAKTGELVGVVGTVGSGKSSLIQAILGEMERTTGTQGVAGSVAYVPQTAWVLNATVQDNVTLGLPFDEERYETAMVASQLVIDMEQLPSGDNTMIGERGINLSGGQKQRVALARAVYADKDIYVLDDPLSALDVHVSQAVFDGLIRGLLRSKLVILVTHNVDLLSRCTRVVRMERGRILEQGPSRELMKSSASFQAFMGEHAARSKESEVRNDDTAGRSSRKSSHAAADTAAAKQEPQGAGKRKWMSSRKETVKAEERAQGAVKSSTLMAYVRAFNPSMPASLTIFTILLMFFLVEALKIGSDYWLAYWSSQYTEGLATTEDVGWYLGIYGAWTAGSLFWLMLVSYIFSVGAVGAATRLHKGMLSSLLRAPMWWFDTTPSGRTLNRCSKDVDEADSQLRNTMKEMITCCIEVLATLILVTVLTQGFLAIILVPALGVYYYLMQLYRSTSRELQRLDSVSKAPIFNNFAESLQGLSSIRSYQLMGFFDLRNKTNLDLNNRAYFLNNAANRWLSIRLEVTGSLLIFSTAAVLIYLHEIRKSVTVTDAAAAGLALTYITEILNTLNWGVRQVTETEMRLNSVERLLENQGPLFPIEAAETTAADPVEAEFWPSAGRISIRNLKLRYRRDLPLALTGLDLDIPAGASVGICGRTGSGKSSLMVTPFLHYLTQF